jgi:biopolymer transport protein TolQ
MFNFFVGNALWHLISQTDIITKFVLLSLLVMSVVCWTILFYKLFLLNAKKRQLTNTLARMKHAQNLDDLLAIASQNVGTVPGYFLSKNLVFLKNLLEVHKSAAKTGTDSREWDALQQNMYNTIDEILMKEESYLPLLSVSAAASPLVGLFGTVWGLIHAFIQISEKQSADIAAVAPGIAEALITTLAGLIVAIPALLMYSYLSTQVRNFEQQFVMVADKFSMIAQQSLVMPYKTTGAQTPAKEHDATYFAQ